MMVLLVEDGLSERLFASHFLNRMGCEVIVAENGLEALAIISHEPVDLVILVLWPEESPEGFLPALSDTCRALREPLTLRQLRTAPSAAEVVTLLHRHARPDSDAAGEE